MLLKVIHFLANLHFINLFLFLLLFPFIGLSCSPDSIISPRLMLNLSCLSYSAVSSGKFSRGVLKLFASFSQPHRTDASNIMCLVNCVQGLQYSIFMHQLLVYLEKKWNFPTVMPLYFILVLILQFFTWSKSFLRKSDTQLNWQFMFARKVYQQSIYWA